MSGEPLLGDVDVDLLGARDTRLAHLTRDNRGVAGRAASGRQNADSRRHAVKVLRGSLLARQNHGLALSGARGSAVRVKDDLADSRPR